MPGLLGWAQPEPQLVSPTRRAWPPAMNSGPPLSPWQVSMPPASGPAPSIRHRGSSPRTGRDPTSSRRTGSADRPGGGRWRQRRPGSCGHGRWRGPCCPRLPGPPGSAMPGPPPSSKPSPGAASRRRCRTSTRSTMGAGGSRVTLRTSPGASSLSWLAPITSFRLAAVVPPVDAVRGGEHPDRGDQRGAAEREAVRRPLHRDEEGIRAGRRDRAAHDVGLGAGDPGRDLLLLLRARRPAEWRASSPRSGRPGPSASPDGRRPSAHRAPHPCPRAVSSPCVRCSRRPGRGRRTPSPPRHDPRAPAGPTASL